MDRADAAGLRGEREHRPAVAEEGSGAHFPEVLPGACLQIAAEVHQDGGGGLGPELLPGPGPLMDQPARKRDPDSAPGVFAHHPPAGDLGHESRAVEASDRLGRGGPDLAGIVRGDRGESEGELAGGEIDPLQAASPAPPEAVPGADPEPPGPVQEDRPDGGRSLELRDLPQSAPLDAEHAAARASGPESAGTVFLKQGIPGGANLPERAVGAARPRRRAGGEDAVRIADEMPLLGADPERAVASFRQVEDPVAPQRRHPFAVEDLEVGAVEARETVEGGQPEKAVARLEDLADPRGWQAVTGGEDLVDVTGEAGQKVDRARLGGNAREDQEDRGAAEREGTRSFAHGDERIWRTTRVIVVGIVQGGRAR